MLKRYDIDENVWNVIRQAKKTIDTQSVLMNKKIDIITPVEVSRLSDEVIASSLPEDTIDTSIKNETLKRWILNYKRKKALQNLQIENRRPQF